MNKRILLIALIYIGSYYSVSAQSAPADTTKKDSTDEQEKPKVSFFQPKLTYLSNSVYSGRKDSATVSYLSPGIEYSNKSGFNASASASYLVSGATHRFDAFSVGAGYDFKITKKWSAGISASKDFYNDSSQAINSSSKGSLSADMSYDLDFIEIGGSSEVLFASTNSYSAGLTLSHGFEFGKEDTAVWTITPTLKAGYGTQDFIHEHTRTKVKRKNQAANVKDGIVTDIVSGSKAFAVLDYEFSLPISFEANNWAFSFTPTYALPVNPTTTTTRTTIFKNGVAQGTPTVSKEREDLSNTFYFELEATWKIPTKKKVKK
ncbi:MAG: hypothetical protein WCP65_05680 [Bacteroidota bacterium]